MGAVRLGGKGLLGGAEEVVTKNPALEGRGQDHSELRLQPQRVLHCPVGLHLENTNGKVKLFKHSCDFFFYISVRCTA